MARNSSKGPMPTNVVHWCLTLHRLSAGDQDESQRSSIVLLRWRGFQVSFSWPRKFKHNFSLALMKRIHTIQLLRDSNVNASDQGWSWTPWDLNHLSWLDLQDAFGGLFSKMVLKGGWVGRYRSPDFICKYPELKGVTLPTTTIQIGEHLSWSWWSPILSIS